MRKKLTVIALAVVTAVLLSAFSVPALALEDGMYEYEVVNGTAVITGYLGSGSAQVDIPLSLGGLPLTGIGDNAFGKVGDDGVKPHAEIVKVTVPASVTSIGDRAFNGTAWIDLPETGDENGFVVINGMLVNYVGAAANVTIPASVRKINIAAFEKDTILSVRIPDSVETIDDYAFYKCALLTSVTFGGSVREIGKSAFYGCAALKTLAGRSVSVMYPALESIGANAFFGCGALTGTIDLGAGLKSVGANAFASCDALSGVRVPDTLESVGSYAFGFHLEKQDNGYEPSQDRAFTVYVAHTAKPTPTAEQQALASYTKTGTAIYKYAQNPDGRGFFAPVHLVWDRLAFPFLLGDVNNDGKMNSSDARVVLRHAAALEKLEHPDDLNAADVNFDGKINSKDARAILRAAAKIAPLG